MAKTRGTGLLMVWTDIDPELEAEFNNWCDEEHLPRLLEVPGFLSAGRYVAVGDQGPTLHLHAVLGKPDGSVVGGHLIEAYVRPTLEVILIQPPSYLRKRKDPETGLALIDIA